MVAVAVVLAGAVLAAVHHAEVVAHRVGEPFGSLVLAVAVTVIEVALIVTLMVSGGPETASLARDTVFVAVMITTQINSLFHYASKEAIHRNVGKPSAVTLARKYSPRETGVLGAQLLIRLDQDGPEPAEPDEAPRPDNTLFLGRSRRGGLKLSGEFDAAGEAAIRAMIDALAKPRPAIDGVPDERSIAARQGDALVDAAHQVLGFGELPDCGGERPHLTMTMDLDDLRDSPRGTMLDVGQRLHRRPRGCSPATPVWCRWSWAFRRSRWTSAAPGAPSTPRCAARWSSAPADAARCPAATAPPAGARAII